MVRSRLQWGAAGFTLDFFGRSRLEDFFVCSSLRSAPFEEFSDFALAELAGKDHHFIDTSLKASVVPEEWFGPRADLASSEIRFFAKLFFLEAGFETLEWLAVQIELGFSFLLIPADSDELPRIGQNSVSRRCIASYSADRGHQSSVVMNLEVNFSRVESIGIEKSHVGASEVSGLDPHCESEFIPERELS